MSKRQARAVVRGPMFAVLLVLVLVACDVEGDLAAYFGTPSPDAGATLTVSPTPSDDMPTAAPTTDQPPTDTPTPTAEPLPTAQPTPTLDPTSTPAWSPMPTRPPGLADFAELRDSADVTDISRLSANGAALVGSTVYFEGRVNEVSENGGRVRARVKVGDEFVFLVYRTDRYWGDHPLVQGDRIRVVGEFLGLSGGPEQLPEIEPIDLVHRFA